MVKRWLIRVLFLLSLACVVGIWIASYFGGIGLEKRYGGRSSGIGVIAGLVFTGEDGNDPYPDEPLHFYFDSGATADGPLAKRVTLGFSVSPWAQFPDQFVIVFPLWLPTMILSALLWFVWRKTRGCKVGRGFPAEPSQPSKSPAASE